MSLGSMFQTVDSEGEALALRRTRYQFDKIARAGGGSYDGWGAPPVD